MGFDEHKFRRSLLVKLDGGKSGKVELEGPISRLNLRHRFPASSRMITFALMTKVALIATLLYFFIKS